MKYILITVYIYLLTGFASAQDFYPRPEYRQFGSPVMQEHAEELDVFIQEFLRAWRSQDAQAVAAMHTQDVEWINAFGRAFRGREDLQKFLETVLFPNFSAEQWEQGMASYEPVSRHYLGNIVVINSQLRSSPGSAVQGNQRRVSLNFVLVKEAGRWEIAQQIISDIRPRRGAGE